MFSKRFKKSNWAISTFMYSAAVLSLILGLGGCASQQEIAKQELKQQLRQRTAQQAKSMKLYQQGTDQFNDEHWDVAIQKFEESIRVNPRNAHAWLALGVIEEKQENFARAGEAFHRAARLEPLRYEPRFNLGCIYENLGMYQQAIESYEEAFTLNEDRVQIMEHLIRCYMRLGQSHDRVAILIDKALMIEKRIEWRSWLTKKQEELHQTSESM